MECSFCYEPAKNHALVTRVDRISVHVGICHGCLKTIKHYMQRGDRKTLQFIMDGIQDIERTVDR